MGQSLAVVYLVASVLGGVTLSGWQLSRRGGLLLGSALARWVGCAVQLPPLLVCAV